MLPAITRRSTPGCACHSCAGFGSSREQVRFADYLARRAADPGCGFRQHLTDIEAAGEV